MDNEKVAYSDSLEKLRNTQAGIIFADDKCKKMIPSFTVLSLAEIIQIKPKS